ETHCSRWAAVPRTGLSQSPTPLAVSSPSLPLNHIVPIASDSPRDGAGRATDLFKFERRPGQGDRGSSHLQREHELLADCAQLFLVDLPKVVLGQHGFQLSDQVKSFSLMIPVATFDHGGEDHAV